MLYSIYHVLMEGGGGGGAVGASAKRKIKPLPNLEHVLNMEFPLETFQITLSTMVHMYRYRWILSNLSTTFNWDIILTQWPVSIIILQSCKRLWAVIDDMLWNNKVINKDLKTNLYPQWSWCLNSRSAKLFWDLMWEPMQVSDNDP